MGPFDIDRQYERIQAVECLLSRKDLPDETREIWTRIRNSIALDEDTYNARVMYTYRNHRKEIVEWNP